jgi:hypothetical protein
MQRTTAPNSVGGLHVDKVPGVTVGTTGVALDRNNLQEEIVNAILGSGASLGVAQTQLRDSIISLSHRVGEPFFSLFKETPSASFPAIRVDDGDHDIAVSNCPDFVPKARAEKLESDSVTDFSGTVAGSVFTFSTNQAANRLLAALAEDELVHGGYTNWLSINIAGTDYAITNINVGARTVTVTGTPPTGAQTGIIYPYRITGSTTTARLRRISGRSFVGTEALSGDTPDRMLLAGLRARDRGQGHRHNPISGKGAFQHYAAGGHNYGNLTPYAEDVSTTGDPVTDGTNGTLRTGKTTEPRTYPGYVYIWAGRYVA